MIYRGNTQWKQFLHLSFLMSKFGQTSTFVLFPIPTNCFLFISSKLDSRKYPLSLPVTVQNVMGFILSNLSKKNRLKAIASIVKYRRKQNQPIENSFAVLRRETENSIVDSLRAWRQNPRKRNYIFMRIQALRRLYFTLYGRADKCDSNKLDKLIAAVQTTWLHETIVR